jgi:serine/threonine protein kinase
VKLNVMKSKFSEGDKIGRWTITEKVGDGGNSSVYRVKDDESNEAALKLLTIFSKDKEKIRYERFRGEVKVIQENQDVEGILPLIDIYLPKSTKQERAWYVIPLAQPLNDYIKDKSTKERAEIVLRIAKTLSELHQRGISHRDIKPPNVLVRDGNIYLADFGLADYPEKLELTQYGESVGAKWTIAPEMQRQSTMAEGQPADVYSLAKTLWILLTDQPKGFEGQYNPEGINGLKNFNLKDEEQYANRKYFVYTGLLDHLIQQSTDDDPKQRPTIGVFIEKLSLWLDVHQDFQRYNRLQWQEIHKKLFPFAVPCKVVWEDISDIIKILNLIGSTDNLNHMMLPDSGGIDMEKVSFGREEGTMEFILSDNHTYIVKPKHLTFNGFPNSPEWNYFRLETGELEPLGMESGLYPNRAEAVEIEPMQYIDRIFWDEGRYLNQPLSKESRLINRYLNGAFLIVQKTSIYNHMGSVYFAGHNKMTAIEFHRRIVKLVQEAGKIRNSEAFIRMTNNDLKDEPPGLREEKITDIIARILDKYFPFPI